MHPTTTSEKIIQSVCELQEMPELDHPETIVISVTDLRTIIENHTEASAIAISPIELMALKKLALISQALATSLSDAMAAREQKALTRVLVDVVSRASIALSTPTSQP